jgi:hypothetical protein
MGKHKRYKREYFYAVFQFVMFEMAVIAFESQIPSLFTYTMVMALWVMLSWSFFTFLLHKKRTLSKGSIAFLNIRMFDRVVPYFITPLLLVASTYLYLFLNKNSVMHQVVIVIASLLIWGSLVHIRNSYKKQYSIDKWTRVVFKFTDLFLFYVATSAVYMFAMDVFLRPIIVIAIGAVLLMHQLRLYKQEGTEAFGVYILSMTFFALGVIFANGFVLLLRPLLMTIIFYLIMSVWYLKLTGHRKTEDYLTPIMFALMAFIVVLGL